MSFIARISVKDGWLLGGTRVQESSRMETRAMAENFGDQLIQRFGKGYTHKRCARR